MRRSSSGEKGTWSIETGGVEELAEAEVVGFDEAKLRSDAEAGEGDCPFVFP